MRRLKDDEAPIRRRLRKARLDKGYTYKKLGDKINMDSGYLCIIERGRANPSIHILLDICNGLEINIKEVIDDFVDEH